MRRARNRVLPRALLGEPAWDILLDLFGRDPDRAGIGTTEICRAADVPYSTALRYLSALASSGLIDRLDDPHDARRNLVRLTESGETALRECLSTAGRQRAA